MILPGRALSMQNGGEPVKWPYRLCRLFKIANTSSELVEFVSDHDIDPAVQKIFSDSVLWDVDMNILAFLSVSPFME